MVKRTALGAFFAKYAHKFTYNPSNAPTGEFGRLCKAMGWEKKKEKDVKDPKRLVCTDIQQWKKKKEEEYKKKQERDSAKTEFGRALAREFDTRFGTRVDSLTSWQLLAKRIGIRPVPSTIAVCKKKFRGAHVNLVDVVHGDAPVQRFESVVALRDYTIREGKIFPRKKIKPGDLLKYLLRQIFLEPIEEMEEYDDEYEGERRNWV